MLPPPIANASFGRKRVPQMAPNRRLLSVLCDSAILPYHLPLCDRLSVTSKRANAIRRMILIDVIKFRFFGTHEFAPGGRIIKEIQNFRGGADCARRVLPSRPMSRPSAYALCSCFRLAPAVRANVSVKRETELILARALRREIPD